MNKDGLAEILGTLIAEGIGWLFCMAMLAGLYSIGSWLAGYFIGVEHKEAAGILSAITFIWLYEHRRADDRWARFLESQSR